MYTYPEKVNSGKHAEGLFVVVPAEETVSQSTRQVEIPTHPVRREILENPSSLQRQGSSLSCQLFGNSSIYLGGFKLVPKLQLGNRSWKLQLHVPLTKTTHLEHKFHFMLKMNANSREAGASGREVPKPELGNQLSIQTWMPAFAGITVTVES